MQDVNNLKTVLHQIKETPALVVMYAYGRDGEMTDPRRAEYLLQSTSPVRLPPLLTEPGRFSYKACVVPGSNQARVVGVSSW